MKKYCFIVPLTLDVLRPCTAILVLPITRLGSSKLGLQ